jgi:hypothetical protein
LRDPKLTFLIRCAYGAVWLALIWLMVRYVLVWLLPFLIALALAALLEQCPASTWTIENQARLYGHGAELGGAGNGGGGTGAAGHGAAAAGL